MDVSFPVCGDSVSSWAAEVAYENRYMLVAMSPFLYAIVRVVKRCLCPAPETAEQKRARFKKEFKRMESQFPLTSCPNIVDKGAAVEKAFWILHRYYLAFDSQREATSTFKEVVSFEEKLFVEFMGFLQSLKKTVDTSLATIAATSETKIVYNSLRAMKASVITVARLKKFLMKIKLLEKVEREASEDFDRMEGIIASPKRLSEVCKFFYRSI